MTLRNDQIAIVHGATNNYQELTDITFPNHAEYAHRHGYVLREFEFYPVGGVWEKIRVLRETFADSNIRRVFWIDADAVFTNMSLSLTDHLPQGKVVVSCDNIYGINAGCLWLENCPEVRRLLAAISTQGRQVHSHHMWAEQAALRYFSFFPPYAELFTYVEPKTMNAYLDSNYLVTFAHDQFYHWVPGNFILHLPGTKNHVRLAIFKAIFSK